MVTPLQGEIWWAQMRVPQGSEPGYRRPVVVVQGDALNRSGIDTVVCVPLTSNRKWEVAPGNVLLSSSTSGLPKPSVANALQLVALNKSRLTERVEKLPGRVFDQVMAGVDIVLGR